jgi:NTP pyrophosphatase (non-canonical NTP hydrolase)
MMYLRLRAANEARNDHWDPNKVLTGSFKATELAGEVGEACNVVKKLERARLAIRGKRDTVKHLAEELADVVICADLLALHYGIDLRAAIIDKFNATSFENGLPVRLMPGDCII